MRFIKSILRTASDALLDSTRPPLPPLIVEPIVEPAVQYTESVPVLTAEMIDKWRAAAHQNFTWQVAVSESPEVLGPDPIAERGLRIWRKGLPLAVSEFVDTAVAVKGVGAGRRLENYFRQFDMITLDSFNEVYGRGQDGIFYDISVDTLKYRLWTLPVDGDLISAFSEHMYDSISGALGQLPEGTRLKFDDFTKVRYSKTGDISHDEHYDAFDNLLLHYSEPGTPYSISGNRFYRSQAGDVTLHGNRLIHGHSTAPPLQNNARRPRICVGFTISEWGL